MAHRTKAVTTVADEVRELLTNSLATGWRTTTVAAEMQKAGHKGWNESVVQAAARENRMFTVDEAIGMLAVFRAHAEMILREIDRKTELIKHEATKGGRR